MLFQPGRGVLIGLGIAFGVPFLSGLLISLGLLLGFISGSQPLTIRLVAALFEIAALTALITVGERRRLGSVGIRPPTMDDLRYGLGVAAVCAILAILVPAAFELTASPIYGPIRARLAALFPPNVLALYRGTFWLALTTIATASIAQELAMRGFVASRIRTLTGNVVVAGAAALAVSLLANLPLWGLAYTVEVAPIEAILVALFLWKRRLLPCIVANFAVGTLLLVLASGAGSAPSRRNSPATNLEPQQQQAIDKLDRALESKFGLADPFVQHATEDAKRGDYEKAVGEMDKAVAAQPKAPALWAYRGDLYSAQNRHDAAIADYSKAISLASDAPGLYLRRANEYVKAGQDVPAHRDFAKAIDLAEDDPLAYIDRSALYVREDRYEEALRDINSAIKLQPNTGNFLLRRAKVFELMHRYDDAIGDCSRIIGLDSSRAEGYACRAQEELVKGDAPAAIADLGEVLKRAPGDAISLFNRADLEVQTQQWSAARADMVALSSTNSLDPESEDWCAYQLATSVHSELRDGKAAIALATRACEATGWGNVKYLETLAAAYAETGDFQQAIKWAQHAIEVARTTDPDPAVKNLLRWELTDRYEKGLPFRADDTGRIVSRPSGRTVLAIIATGLALIGLVTVIVLSGRLLLRLRRGTA